MKIIVILMEHKVPMCSRHNTCLRTDLQIAGLWLAIDSFQSWEEEAAFYPFIRKEASVQPLIRETEIPDYHVAFHLVEELPVLPENVIHEDECYRVHSNGMGEYVRSFFDAPRDFTPYAVATCDHINGRIQIDCLPKGVHCVSEMHNSFFHIGFESILIHRERLCIHAACTNTRLGGLLFSGPSGIGKSTQAELWNKHRGAKLINGDRPILSKADGRWMAWGSPYAGSSKCHINENCPVTAIIMLEQAEKCSLRRLTLIEAFQAVWSGLTVYNWDKSFVEKAVDLTMDLIRTIPVYQYCCTPDAYAVEYLEQELEKGGSL